MREVALHALSTERQMPARTTELQRFIDVTHNAIATRVEPGEPADAACQRIFKALETCQAQHAPRRPEPPPAWAHLHWALDSAAASPAPAAALADALAIIEPQLCWERRPGAERVLGNFADGHANAIIVGDGGLEPRGDVRIGVSLLAPQVTYPDHRHPPEELYAVLSPGFWRQDARPWHEPGPGGVVYNRPNVVHAMRSTDSPLLAIWCLWTGAREA
ncbi:MAG: dimethylsulfonioproprionate lyase family protein [Hyphomicrobiaceae bacterium]